jgi:integrase
LPRFVIGELEAHLPDPGDPNDHVFTAPNGGPLRVTAFRARAWRPATKAPGLDGLHIHDLRHTAMALWIAAAASPRRLPPWAVRLPAAVGTGCAGRGGDASKPALVPATTDGRPAQQL